jgi:GNAT superfamily N-acetyltransferase
MSPTQRSARVVARLAVPDELDAAGAAVRAAYAHDGHAHDGYLETLADARDRSTDAEIGVAVDTAATPGTEAVVGSVTFALPGSRWAELSGPDEAEFRMLGVLPSARGLGAGSALVQWSVDRARSAGAHRLVICSLTAMTTAHGLYARHGFVRRPDLDWSPYEDIRLIGFSLDL